MSEKESPSTINDGGKGSGVLDHLKGAKSRDTESESVLTAEEEAAASASTGPDAPDELSESPEPEKAKKSDDDALVQLRQRNARMERQLAEMGPWAQVGLALQNDPQGKEILARIQRGERLSAADQSEAQDRGLTRAELEEALNQRDAAKAQIDEITRMAEENLPHYKEMRKNPKFRGFVDATLAAAWNGTLPLSEKVADWENQQAAKNYTAIEFAHKMYLMENPKVKEAVKEAGRREAKEKAESALAGELSSGSSSSSSGEGKELTPEEAIQQRMLNARGVGKSFSKAFGR